MARLETKESAPPSLSPEGIASHGLTEEEYRKIVELLGREPNFTELGVFSVMWSEHCSYKSSKNLLKLLPTEGPAVLQGPGENAGVVDIGDGQAAVFKIESHNHPSFIEPYQGAATGVGGILRDIFTMGARPIASLNSLRFGSFDHPRTRYLLNGVVAGIGGYGNCVGVPTVGGEVFFDECYNANILVNAFTLGIAKKERLFPGKATGEGNSLIYVGAKTGRDGIHGATMASESFSQRKETRRPTVQVGDPFTEKLLLEACLELMEQDYLIGVQDMGAAGLTSSSAEMAGRGGTGVELDLSLVPLREKGMTPYEILLSESQERMLLVVKKGSEEAAKRIFERWDLDAVVVGKVTPDRLFRASFNGEEVVRIPIAALTAEAPVYHRPAERPQSQDEIQKLELSQVEVPKDLGATLKNLLDSPNIASKRWVYRQYDQFVRSNTVVAPGADAAVIRIKGTDKGLALTVDGNGRYCYLDPYVGGILAVAEAARNLACVGAHPLGLTDCLNFGGPENPAVMWQFSEVIRGMRDSCTALAVPVVSGNVSFYNETDGVPIYPTPVVGMVGLLPKVERHVTPWFKSSGDLVVLLGRNREELGGSEYLKLAHGLVRGTPPWIDLRLERAVQQCCLKAIERGMIRSAHDISEGGLAVALVECCVGGSEKSLGVKIDLPETMRQDARLFGESQSRIIVSIKENDLSRLETIAEKEGVPVQVLGEVGGSRFIIQPLIQLAVDELKSVWSDGLERRLQ
ncbi:MAG TPA: phosphoribosylformylglycinamidine synthase subunit PurL [Candidatus Binatia bacterium]|jgi:phosphoribosylformylglycinamidine synthase|nr:phosphoribosylformylglycinamidine synthase subunit PurL [Candidatus Binatia bacterium]